MIRRCSGVFVLLMGLMLAGWIFYNLFIQRLPETQGRSPLGAIFVAGAFIYVGFRWMRGQSAG